MGIKGRSQLLEHVLKVPPDAVIRRVLIQIAQGIFASPARPGRILEHALCLGPLPGVAEEKFP